MSGRALTCPMHKCRLLRAATRYGARWSCPIVDCSVVCWGGDTSTPADQQTRDLRHAVHLAFDPLWHDAAGPFCAGKRPNKRAVRRSRAYRWLSRVMGLDINDTHIGYFDADQCRKAMEAIESIRSAAVSADARGEGEDAH